MAIFKGAGVAIVTPMKSNGEVNYEKLEELIDFQIKEGTQSSLPEQPERAHALQWRSTGMSLRQQSGL